jgi:phosphatidylglycerol---prolipoprotein diacylglyceryl transferase
LNFSPYSWLLLAGIAVSLVAWSRIAKRDERLLFIYISALVGAFLGAKVVYLLAEGWIDWRQPDRWLRLATGKTIIGGLLGGYAAVEITKKIVGYRSATGDWFVFIAPTGIIFGRIGCLLHGCCTGSVCRPVWYAMSDKEGTPRWPSVPVEIIFNLVALGAAAMLRWKKILPGQHFHLYLVAYGLFRFAHEFVRATPRIIGPLSGYAIAALVTAAFGAFAFVKRSREVSQT